MLRNQHGDVLLYEAPIPKGAKKVKKDPRGVVLAEGEATGHAHVVTGGSCALLEHEGRTFLSVKEPVTVRHQEHKPQVIQPGNYEVKQVREVDPFSEEVRKVRD